MPLMAPEVDPEGRELEALARVADLRGLRVLDVGCGDGRLVWRIADTAAFVLGVDPDEEAIAAAQDDLPPRLRDKVRFRAVDVAELDEPPSQFDLAFFTWSL